MYFEKKLICLETHLRDPQSRDECLAELDDHVVERERLYVTQCTCQGGIFAERDQTIAICESYLTGDYLDDCKKEAWATQEKARKDCVKPCTDLAHLNKNNEIEECKAVGGTSAEI